MARAYIAVGSNLGGRLENLYLARQHLRREDGIELLRSSPFYETLPVGGPEGQSKYLNAVWEIETPLEPHDLLVRLQEIEKRLGRERSVPDAPRTLDLDLLIYEDRVIDETGLTLPHPRLHERLFVLKPLCDLAPRWRDPRSGLTARQLMEKVIEAGSPA